MDKRFFEVKERKSVADSTTQNPSDDVSRTVVGRQLTVGDGKCYRTNMVNDYPNGNVYFVLFLTDVFYIIFGVFIARKFFHFRNKRCENISVVIGRHALN